MTFLSNSNQDAYSISPDAAATGPLVGFFDSWSAAVDAQMRTSAQYGIEFFMQELDWQQTGAMIDAGVEAPPQLMLSLEGREAGEGPIGDFSVAQLLRRDSGYYEDFIPNRSEEYLQVARRYAGQEISPEFEERLQAYDARVTAIREQHPDLELRTSREMFERVREDATAAERREQTDRRTWGGAFGGFFGGALASMHPGTDPLNFYTLGAGGAGKTAVQRVLFQTGAQGVVETINQVTGVQEERELLGLSHGFSDAAQRVAATALGAGALQGAGELVAAGARRWFRNTAEDPAPAIDVAEVPREPIALPAPDRLREEAQVARVEQNPRTYIDTLADRTPLSGIRAGRTRSVLDIADTSRQLEDWAGGDPAFVHPRTASAAYPGQSGRAVLDTRAATDNARLYQMAREADPSTFNQYDRLLERRNTYRRWVEELAEKRDADVQSTMDNIDARIHSLEARLRAAQGKGDKAKIREQIREARSDREALIDTSRQRETPDIAEVRRQLIKTDEKMRDLAPLIGRAYARARGRWGETVEELDAVWDAYRQGRAEVDMPPSDTLPGYDTALTLTDRAPILQGASRVEAAATSAETAQRIVAENAKAIDAALEGYREQVKRLVEVTDEGTLRVDGRDYEFNIDKDTMFVPHEDGTGGREVTLREYLAENRRAEYELEAVSTCSIR